jgi:outer membrane receptor protein involved in Fe transport
MSLNFLPFICTVKKYPFMRFLKSLLTAVLVLFTILYTQAQVTTSSMSGVVKTNDGKLLEDATVVATHNPTGTVYRTKTRKGGRFDINNMNTGGPYTVEVSFVGYGSQKKEDVFLQLGDAYAADFDMLDAKADLATVTVASTRARITKSGPSSNFGQRQINTLPNISRSITGLTTLTPQAGGNNSFGGRDGRYNNISIDGANLNNNFGLNNNALPGGAIQPISLDAIDEISVSLSPYDSRQGNFTGANIQAVTRKGTNKLSGSAYYFYRNEGLLGRVTENKRVPNVDKSFSLTYGGRLGGAIIKNKLFFFVNAEVEEREAPGINWKASRQGVAPDVNTSRTLAKDLDSLSQVLKAKYNYTTGPYENLGNFKTKGYKMLGRLDWNVSEKHAVSLRYNYSLGDDDVLLNGRSSARQRTSNRWSNNSMSYENSNYANRTEVTSYAFDVKSNFSSKFSNQFLATYTTKIDPERSSKSSPFPMVDILDGAVTGDNYLAFGYEPFTWKNKVDEKTFTINDNFTINLNSHTIGIGVEYNRIAVSNSFQRFGTSYYQFASLSDFYTDKAPTAFGYTFTYPGVDPLSKLNFSQYAFYVQDEIKFNSRFKMMVGIRLDKADYGDDPVANPAIAGLTFRDWNGNPYKVQADKWPVSPLLVNPRLGFTWDVKGDKSMLVRGGFGLFTGRNPFVWFTNQPSNAYGLQGTVEYSYDNTVQRAFLNTIKFNPNPDAYRDSFPKTPTSIPSGSILAGVDPNFKLPRVFRFSLGFDQKLSEDVTFTMEMIYNKDINALAQYNVNRVAANGTPWNGSDKRAQWLTARSVVPTVGNALVLTNTDKGQAFVFTAQLQKRFSKNWEASIAYTFTHSMDNSSNPGAQANQAWQNNSSVSGQNDLEYSISEFSTPNRFVGFINYRFEWLRHFGTQVSLVYTGFNAGRNSYVYNNDVNNDGNTGTDLLYIPKDRSDIIFVPTARYSAQQQADAFWDYVAQDDYLNDHKGQYAERNGVLLPFLHRLDFRLLQDLFTNVGKSRHTLQLSLEVENFTNMLNSDWGVTRIMSRPDLLRFAGLQAGTGLPTFTLQEVRNQLPTSSFEIINSVSQTWRANLGLRYSF